MKLLDWLLKSMNQLAVAGVDSPRRDCMVFAEDLLGKDRSWVNAHAEYELDGAQVKILDRQIERRINREPLAYIRGKAWFYKRFFKVTPDVLIPRPESESFIEILKTLDIKSPKVADIGTGSGCLGITAALEIPNATVDLYDNDSKALKIAQENAQQYQLKMPRYESDLFENLKDNYDILLANLPYVPNGLITSPEITKEPAEALFSGKDGLDHYRKFWQQVGKLSSKPKYILTESLESQHSALITLAEAKGYTLKDRQVLVNLFGLK